VPIRQLVKMLPAKRQNLFFSATMPGEIGKLAGELLHTPEHVAVTPVATTAERVAQRAILIETSKKRALLIELLQNEALERVLVFARTKHGADKVAQSLAAAGHNAAVIHGNKSQGQRLRALESFKTGQARILVATDIAARGIDVEAVSHVINFDLPDVPESYVHRIGRTARAGASGEAIAFCDADERSLLRDIEKLTRQTIPLTDRRSTITAEAAAAHAPSHARDSDHRRADHRKPKHGGGKKHHGQHASQNGKRAHGGGKQGSKPFGKQQSARPSVAKQKGFKPQGARGQLVH